MADFNIFSHLNQMGFGRGQEQQSGDGIANEKETPEIILEGAKKVPGTTAKLSEAIPLIGWILAKIIPMNAGEVSAFASFETQGIAGKTINPGKGGLTGGALYNAVFAPLIKNSTITDHTGGAGGGGGGGGDSGSGGGAMASSGGFSDYSHMNLGGLEVGGGNFEWSSISMASLGALPRPVTPDVSGGPEMGIG